MNDKRRCSWAINDSLMIRYHDEEWGVPVHDEIKHFEFLVLESAQAGLSWLTILKRRENYRRAFNNFNPDIIAAYNENKIDQLLNDPGIIRNRRKILAAVNNANKFLEIQNEFHSFDAYIWKFVNKKPVINEWKHISDIPATTELSDIIAKDMKKRGFQFIGSTIIYAHLQAIGLVNDHLVDCFRYHEIIRMY